MAAAADDRALLFRRPGITRVSNVPSSGKGRGPLKRGKGWAVGVRIAVAIALLVAAGGAMASPTGGSPPPEHGATRRPRPNPDSPAVTPDSRFGAALAAGPKLSVG